MKTYTSLFLILFLFVSCAGSPYWQHKKVTNTEKEAKRNNQNMMKLRVGQTREHVLNIMGTPTKLESYKVKDAVIYFLFYRTQAWAIDDLRDRDEQFTPIAIKDNRVIGWGRNFYDKVVRISVELMSK